MTDCALPPLIFAVHRWQGRLSPALYHDARLPRWHDSVVYSLRLDTQPDWVQPADAKPGDILFLCWELFQQGALPPSENIGSVGRY